MKYKLNRKLIDVVCNTCQKLHTKPESEYNRNLKLSRNNYCSRSCCGKNVNNIKRLALVNSFYDISQHSSNNRDQFTGFRYYFRNSKKRFKEFTITLEDLKTQWALQKGICPYTNLSLIMHTSNQSVPFELRASLDRIDSSIGYVPGNIEFISLPINYLKSDQYSKEQTLNFLKQISSNFH